MPFGPEIAYPVDFISFTFTKCQNRKPFNYNKLSDFRESLVIPEFSGVFQDQDVPLPLPTRMVVGVANFLAYFWWLCILVLVAVGMLVTSYIRTPRGRFIWDRTKLRLPLVGALLGKASILRFAQTLGRLLRAGVPFFVSF